MTFFLSFIRKKITHLIKRTHLLIYKVMGKTHVHFLHINKTGGSAIKEGFNKNLVSSKYFISLHGHHYNLKSLIDEEQVIFFLRDPCLRFISGFKSRKRQGAPKYHYPWTLEESIAFSLFDTPDQLAMALSSEEKNIKQAAHLAMQNIHHVRTSYQDWFISKDFFLSKIDQIFFIGLQETLGTDFHKLTKKLQLPSHLKLPHDPVKAHKAPSDLGNTLSSLGDANIRDWYKSDYEFYYLCKELKEEINNK